jgi:hypothetical protein
MTRLRERSADYHRAKAEEMRRAADNARDPDVRATYVELAEHYDALAVEAEEDTQKPTASLDQRPTRAEHA